MARKNKSRLSILKRHAIDSLLGIAPHAHTGKRLHRKHTSHGAIFIALLVTGVLLFSNLGTLHAFAVTKAGSVNISVNVVGAPPHTGAVISFPENNSLTNYSSLTVVGTCPDQTLVSVYNNGVFAGSGVCDAGLFRITAVLTIGTNIIQAQNYDGLNQPGPSTTAVIVVRKAPVIAPTNPEGPLNQQANDANKPATDTTQVIPQIDPVVVPTPNAPSLPAACTDVDESPVQQAQPTIAVGCIIRNVFAGEKLSMPLTIKGGVAPFALSVDWGDEKQDLITVLDNKKKLLAHTYDTGGFHQITMKATDSGGASTQMQTTVSVNGELVTGTVASNIEQIIETAKSIWVEAPVPLYFAALALAVGFWVGDVFERFTLSPQHIQRRTKRHA